jgi:hypothetical protein
MRSPVAISSEWRDSLSLVRRDGIDFVFSVEGEMEIRR